jgi:hypothetical protein
MACCNVRHVVQQSLHERADHAGCGPPVGPSGPDAQGATGSGYRRAIPAAGIREGVLTSWTGDKNAKIYGIKGVHHAPAA